MKSKTEINSNELKKCRHRTINQEVVYMLNMKQRISMAATREELEEVWKEIRLRYSTGKMDEEKFLKRQKEYFSKADELKAGKASQEATAEEIEAQDPVEEEAEAPEAEETIETGNPVFEKYGFKVDSSMVLDKGSIYRCESGSKDKLKDNCIGNLEKYKMYMIKEVGKKIIKIAEKVTGKVYVAELSDKFKTAVLAKELMIL